MKKRKNISLNTDNDCNDMDYHFEKFLQIVDL